MSPELEDAEAELVLQEKWGWDRVGLAAQRLTAAVRLVRTALVSHEQRLAAVEARLDVLDPPAPPPVPPS